MSQLSSILRKSTEGVSFHCPGCNRRHHIRTGPNGWVWNGDAEKPTFQPSILVTYPGKDAGADGAPPAVCHSFVTDGQIQFLGDCFHALKGQTVEIPDWDSVD